MFVLSMKTTRARIAAAVVIVLLLVAVMVVSRSSVATMGAVTVSDDEARRDYIASLGYTLAAEAPTVREVMLPADFDDTLAQYNALQQTAGYDLDAYRGCRLKRYTYAVTGLSEDAVVNLYVYKNAVVGGDVSSTAAGGFCRALTPSDTDGKGSNANGTLG